MEKDNQSSAHATMLQQDLSCNPKTPVSPDISSMETIPIEYLDVGPMDGQYAKTGKKLSPYFSEYALVKNRVKVEVYWIVYLLDNCHSKILDSFGLSRHPEILSIYDNFSPADFMRVKEFEAKTNHDVKSV